MHNMENEEQLQEALSGAGREIELDVGPEKPSETIEVEDVVSADTNNAALNF